MAANDWIRLNKGFITKPEVIRTAVALKVDKWRAACAWITILDWADDLTEDGFVPRMDGDAIDAIVELPGFFAVACAVEWMAAEGDGVRFINYTRYNTKSAKARSVDAKRQARKRCRGRNSDETRTKLGRISDDTRTDLRATETLTGTDTEKTENAYVDADASTHAVEQPRPEFSQRVEAIYDACTWRKEKPREAKKAIAKAGKRVAARYFGDKDKAFEFLMARVLAYAKSPYVQTTDRQFLPLPASWFNADRFDDPDEAWNQTRKESTNGHSSKSTRRADGTRPGEYEEHELLANLPIVRVPRASGV